MTILKSIRIDEKVFDKLKIIADKEKRTVSNLINKVLSDFTSKM